MMPRITDLFFICSFLYISHYCAGFFLPCVKPEWFECSNGKCVSFIFECDGDDDCGDNSDEQNCTDFKLVLPSSIICSKDEFQCKNYACIPTDKFCDKISDCADGSDEYVNCIKDLKCDDKFRCNDGYCVRKEWICDGTKDCSDNSDELNCGNNTLIADNCKTENNRYLCQNQRCISLSTVCDKVDNCGDKSDEGTNCENGMALCKSAECSNACKITPNGPVCICPPGYTLQNNRTCIDIDECTIYGICDQRCVNTMGSYSCICQAEYILQDDMKTCKASGGEATMAFSTKTEIRAVYLDSQIYFVMARNLSHAVGVALDGEHVYWSEAGDGSEAIVKGNVFKEKNQVIVTTGLHSLSDIAVDWITGNIYFTDDGYMRIGVCDNNGTYCTVLINEQTNNPRGIALLPTKGIMYWTDWGSNPHIAIAGMDGKNSSLFVAKNLGWPNGLTIDYPNNRLYWVDAKKAIIESIRLDGTDRRIILHDIVKHPFSLAVFENKLYWSDWETNTIQTCDKFTGKDWKIISRTSNKPYGVHIDHIAMKPKSKNPCYWNPCSQLCLLNRNNSYTCACTLDKELNSDKHTCRGAKKRQHIIVAAGDTFINYYHELLGKPTISASVTLKHITAITYDSLSGIVLASDRLTDNIFSYNPINGDIKSFISIKNEILGGMAFDHTCNNLYLSNIERKTIEVHSLTTAAETVFYFGEQPYDIVLIPEDSVMFVVFRGKNSYHIDKMQSNGIGLKTRFVDDLLGPKISLCYDGEQKKIFWSDQGTGRIESATITGFDKYLFRTGLREPVNLAIAGEHIFWTQRGSNRLFWADKNNIHQNNKHVVLRMSANVEIPYLVASRRIVISNEVGCLKNNGDCSHVCLPSSHTSYICACPPGMMLSANNRTCNPQTACSAEEIKCSEHDVCIKIYQWCNGIKECPNGEDEPSDCTQTGTCGKDQFMCKNGACINSKDRCNSHYDCADRSDEDDCDKKECHTNEFQCHEGSCISNFLVCDGRYDCSDFSDELNCATHTCAPDTFMCDNRKCIPKQWECDGEVDCPDGSDEVKNCNVNACNEGKFKCANDRCISLSLKCNGFNDCGDDSDERRCPNRKNHSGNCTDDEYPCYNTDICIPKRKRCNGVQDCPKNDDEHNCAYCGENEFVCDNQKCIPQSWVCDKTDDCGDKSDEKECGGSNLRSVNANLTSSECEEFKCSTGTCLPFNKVCDGIGDCPDHSDERGKCTTSCTQNNHCHNLCYKTPLGAVCGCREGYRLSADMISCDDINECEHEVCSQICYNTLGSFECSCYNGYVIRSDKVSCKVTGPPMAFITASESDIRKISFNLRSIEVIHPLSSLSITGLDANAIDDTVYWSSDELGIINRINIKTKESKMITNVGSPEALAIDWITNNIYFNDNDRPSTIKVCNLESQKCATMVKIEGTARVTSLILEPKNRWLFWSQTTWKVHDNPFSEICRTNMMGSDMRVIGFRNIGVVSGMAIDHIKSRLYWADSFRKAIESSNLDGTQRSTFLTTDMYQPLSINIYENSLYWLMSSKGSLQKCKLYGEKLCETINVGSDNVRKHFTILHVSKHPLVENSCNELNCDYLCVLKDGNATCICQDGNPIKSEHTCAENAKNNTFSIENFIVGSKHIRQQGSAVSAIIITIVIAVTLLSAFCYYQKSKLNSNKLSNVSFSSIRFQNPSYDRRDEVAAMLSSIPSNLSPGEHEYTNPINEKLLQNAKECSIKKAEMISSDQVEEEFEEKQNISFISLIRTK